MINIAIIGYGNLGRGVEKAIKKNNDMTLVGIFTRRQPETVTAETAKVYSMDDLFIMKDDIDVCILCGGSATDLPKQTPELTEQFNTIDSFDTHANIPTHFDRVNKVAKQKETVSIISIGWDPGLFSVNRLYAESILPDGETLTFWGKGVSQGHSDALRRLDGVQDAIQYTIPNDAIIERLKTGESLDLTTRDKHTRECYIVLEEGADETRIREQIVTMPNYFDEYDTTIHVISQEELEKNHKQKMPHGGKVLRVGQTSAENKEVYDFSLALDSNPEFTASTLVAYARAAARLAKEERFGAYTIFDIAPSYISPFSADELRQRLL
ncbi:diaminopimelate dehydrogenase [Vagococcus penaei]|uniref:Meso-diaminopimelate D-dehydrogenase n=1 Tax=Vagococcus penaei TaxID=633807 RepID=A0A1Q2D3D4_9ENTE|nr:diaminopimelate dehydrogenase [Vagococcus penaei]AQP52843.1 diaminopimelate dehydrogenase [Vagococcus penaei]RSU01184.1 diaminopimelate dehydrogenase [Vagococcus penaei]